MPLFDFLCNDCGRVSELLMTGSGNEPKCTACCGAAPGQASGCAGPGTCCGKAF